LSRLIFLSERHLRTTIAIFADYYRQQRNHQGIQNKLIEPRRASSRWAASAVATNWAECSTITTAKPRELPFSRSAEFFGSTGLKLSESVEIEYVTQKYAAISVSMHFLSPLSAFRVLTG
jgi:hypothetical protein